MPLIELSAYRAPRLLRDGHLSTLLPSVMRRVRGVAYTRERFDLPDGDFIDLDWAYAGADSEGIRQSKKLHTTDSMPLVILTHGYLGNTTRAYMLGAAKAFQSAGYDVLAWNMRGLSGELNRTPMLTSHGSTYELAALVTHAIAKGYTDIALVGFSKGGNITLKYVGELGERVPPEVKKVVAISVPADMTGSVGAFAGTFYERHFVRKMHRFMQFRASLLPEVPVSPLQKLRTLDEITTQYVAPIIGMKTYADYCEQTSSLPYLSQIRVPTLVLNAQNDPVLSESCSPQAVARTSDFLFLETPEHGGHCGFYEKTGDDLYWMDRRAVDFVKGHEHKF